MFCRPRLSFRRRLSSKPELSPLPRTYDARFVDSRWYDWWRSREFFSPRTGAISSANSEDIFTVLLPPPNVTGSLHLGHAQTIAIEDAILRYQRMNGRKVLWIPGLDHAGIATQVQVERDLWTKRKLTRHDVGREEFLRLAQEWKNEKSQLIQNQIRRLGAGVAWDRLVFTLDDKIQHGVREAFIRLHEQGKVYRQERLVNWCGHLRSTISDIEVEHREIPTPTKLRVPGEKDPVEVGFLNHFAYPVLDANAGEEIVVATTRLETMVGDVAVAVHPDDKKYAHLHGRYLRHPLLDYTIPIVLDASVNPTLGTGAVKITSAHDYKDFEIGRKHSLPSRQVIDDTGRMISSDGEIHGQSRFAAKKIVERMLKEKNCWRGQFPHPTVIPLCSRSGDIIEPQLKKQWFLRCGEYAARAREVVERGELEIIPSRFVKQWHQWLMESKTQDWCLSRQLWWGQRIPAFSASIDGEEKWVCAHTESDARSKMAALLGDEKIAASWTLQQDNDVLDTWFTSSALPFLVFGWPNDTVDYRKHYPLSLMETGHDILFFWVARMVILGLALTDRVPFKKVLLHGLITDKNGKKMSKSTGNVIDPMEILADIGKVPATESGEAGKIKGRKVEIGSDGLRFALCRYETQQQSVSVDLKHIEEANKFCNKIWQAFFLCSNVWTQFPPCDAEMKGTELAPQDVHVVNEWILLCLQDLITNCQQAMDRLTLDEAVNSLHHFMQEQFCDIYLECVKPHLRKTPTDTAATEISLAISNTMSRIFDVYLRLNSLFMPNLSEELYQRLPSDGRAESICVAPYPSVSELSLVPNSELQQDMQVISEVIHSVRHIRQCYGLTKERVPVYLNVGADYRKFRQRGRLSLSRNNVALSETNNPLSTTYFSRLVGMAAGPSQSSEVHLTERSKPESTSVKPPMDSAFDCLPDDIEIRVMVGQKFDINKERQLLQTRIDKIGVDIQEVEEKIQDKEKIPDRVRHQLEMLTVRRTGLQNYLATVSPRIRQFSS